MRIEPDDRVGTAGVFPSGRLLVNPTWFLDLGPREAAFVLAHELLHLALRTHQRAGGDARRFNAAHDYIINDMLEGEFGIEAPGGGLRHPGARYLSAEQIATQLGDGDQGGSFEDGTVSPLGAALRDALRKQQGGDLGHGILAAHGSDVLSSELERQWFPDQSTISLEGAVQQVERAAAQAVSLEQIQERAREAAGAAAGHVYAGDDRWERETAYVRALKTLYRPPWESALHRWLDAVAPGARTYTRASRRGADRPTWCCRAASARGGRCQSCWTPAAR